MSFLTSLSGLDDRSLLDLLLSGRSRCFSSSNRPSPPPSPTPVLHEIATHSPAQWRSQHGLEGARWRRCAALAEVHHRLVRYRPIRPVALHSPEQVTTLMGGRLAASESMCFYCLPLDARRHLIGDPVLCAQGDVDAVIAQPRVFFRPALRCGAVSAIAVHNHPTGCCIPSYDDVRLTRLLVRAGRLIGISLHDQVVLAGDRFASLRQSHPHLFGRATK